MAQSAKKAARKAAGRSRPAAKSSTPKKSAPRGPAKGASQARPKRPAAIPAKQWKGLGDVQKRRYARYFAKPENRSKSLQEARGHKPREHVGRSERERAKVDAWAEGQAAKMKGADADELAEALWDQIKREGKGMRWFEQLRKEIERMHREYMAQNVRDLKGRRPSLGYNLDELAAVWELPPEIMGYH